METRDASDATENAGTGILDGASPGVDRSGDIRFHPVIGHNNVVIYHCIYYFNITFKDFPVTYCYHSSNKGNLP